MNPKAMAVAFTALMLASTMPAGEARHIDPLVPDVPILPRVYATQDCIPVGVDATILARVNQALAGDPAFYQDDLGVPSLCVNGPVAEYQQFVNDANALLEHVRSVSREIQRQVNWRLEGTLPESSYPNDLVEPRTVLLNDSFDGYRTGGFGDWNVISQRGEDALWSIETIADPNGTVHAYRFGGDAGYERGAHQWLVSPEIDLTALKGNRTAVRDLAYLRETAREHLRYMCNTYRGGNAPQSYGSGDYVFLCGESGSISENSPTQGAPIDVTLPRLHAVVEAYEMAFDDAIYTLPVMQHGAHLDLTYRLNMAPGEDGVRMWIYTGDRAPDRRALFNDTLLRFEASRNCAYHQQTAANVIPQQYDDIGGILSTNQPTYELTCPPTQQGGDIVRDQEAYDNFPTNRERRGGLLVPLEPGKDEGMSATRAFASTPGGGDVFNRVAFTGDVAEWLTARVNLTDWMGDRVWILFEVKTLPNERGDDIFSDTSRFPRQKDFGFQLAHVRVEGDGYHRNFRLKDTAATYVYQIPGNDFNDDTRTRTTTPPGNAPILTWVHNAGDYTENGTVTISVRAKSNATSASFETLGTVRRNVTLEPDQVLTLAVPWGEVLTANHQTLREGWLYEVSASLTERINGTGTLPQQVENLSRTPPILDPNATRVMPANAASIPQLNAGNLSLVQNVRAATIRDVTLLRADRTSGNPLQLCRAPLPLDLRCDEHYAGPKGEPRSVLVGVRNDGNTPQNITLDLSAYLDGVGKPDIIMDDAQKIARDVLPGEVRAVTWTVIASQPGAYDLVITPVPEVPAGVAPPPVKPAERKLYVQRSTGLLCLDSIVERECGPTFNGDLEAVLRGQNITAATITPLGALYVATEVREAESEVHSGLLAVRDPVGTWQVLANLSGTVLNETFQAPRDGFGWGAIRSISVAPNGTVFLVGDNDTALRYTPGATGTGLSRIAVNGTMETRLNASAWYKDTLLVVGANGFIGTLVNDTLEPFNVTNTSYEKNDLGQNVTVQRRYAGNFTSLVVAPTGQAVVAGERGVILRHDAARPVTTGWSEARAAGTPSRIVSDALGNRTIHTLGVHGDRVVAGGLELLWASAANGTNGWTAMAMPVPVPETTPRNFTSLAGGRDGRLYALYGNNVAACSSCYGATADWANFLPVRPTVTTSGPLHAAQPAILLAGNATTLLLGEAGMVLELVVSGLPTSLLDWSVVDPLAPRDGGVLQTRRPASNTAYHDMAGRTAANQARTVLLVPDDGGRDAAQRATKFRLFLNHSLNWSGPNKGLEIRLVYRPYPAIVQEAGGATINTCAPDAVPAVRGVSTGAVCKQELLRYVVGNFSNPARFGAGWRHDVWSDLPVARPVGHPAPGSDPVGAWFFGVEINVTDDIRYAVDDIRLQGWTGTAWEDVVAWYGPQKKTGDWYIEDLYNLALRRIGQPDAVPIPNTCVGNTNICTSVLVGQIRNTDTLIQGSGLGTRDERYGWEVVAGSPFDIEAFNPWHVSTDYADRPVFAANNEFYKPNWAEPREPRLMSNWDARLVSPVIDLGDAYDPVVAWRHLYSFRTAVTPSRDKVQAADGGFVEVQYTMKGEECGSTNPETTCWSAFFPVKVDGFARGYPNKNQVGFRDVGTYVDETFLSTQHIHTNAYPPVRGRIGNEKSFWGSIALPDATGRITDTRLTEKYVPASVTLANVECTPSQLQQMRSDHTKRFDCLPHNVTGRQIRVAFHLMTAGNYAHVTNGANISNGSYVPETYFNATTSDTLRSFPGEGWYITDFRVLGARQLGIDLAAKNLTFRVGYDVATIGVGPGTRVPINVTVENRGVFDALGYTGRLEVRRVLDRITQRTEVVDVIQLPQQPVLDKGKSVNHTLFWNVPATEGAEYALTFEVIPIGIPRDEDHLDNTQRLGTIALPIPAKTVRQFKIEFLVSPENATADITRYLPMFINNTGNVPLDGFTVERRITAIGRNVVGDAQTCAGWQARVAAGLQTAIVDCRQWTTQRPAAAGVLTPLTIISDDVSPTTDLFWKAPERATFLVSLTARTTQAGAELVSSAERRVAAFATYLFDDVEGGPRGDAMSGQWVFGPGWNVSQPGFRSTDSYAFGDLALGRYPADTDGQLLAPVIDLGSARTATLAFYTNFAFEPGFDGAVIEASDDGGISWTPLVPLDKPGISASYNKSYPMQAASSIHRTGDPEKVSTAFTHRSSNLPGSVDGWVLSQVELTNYANVTETDVEYEAYHAAELSRYARPPSLPTAAPNLYYAPDWCPGDPADGRCWMVQNMTQGIKAPTAAPGQTDNTFWWSGSAARFDDHMRPVQNHLLEFEIDLAGVTAGQTVQAEWWEYQSRFNARSYYLDTSDPNVGRTLTAPGIYTVHTFHPGGVGSDNYRFNLGEPKVVESRGKWYRMQADLTPILERLDGAGTRTLTVGFAYTPVQDYHNDLTCTPAACTMPASLSWNALQNSTETSGTVYIDRSANDRGFAIDGFKVDVFRVTRGAEGPRTTIFRESDIVAKIEAGQGGIRECGIGKPDRDQGGTASRWSDGTPSYVGCLDNNAQVIRRAPLSLEEGRNWAIVTEIPGVDSSWRPVQVRDPKGYSNRTGEQLPTGDIPHAWYTGDLLCREDPEQRGRAHAEVEPFCPNLHSQARLITPVFDLARVAGDNAQLAFWHRFAFHQRNVSNTPLASGGVVEISVFDAQTGQWSDWQQMYATKDMRIGDSLTPVRDGTRGGYTGYTANVSKAADGQRRYDPPFHNVFSPDRDTPVQFLYTGNSKSIEENSGAPDGLVDGWLREEFDVSDYIGRKVRFGFHYAFSPALSQTSIQLSNPDQRPNAPGDGSFDRTGWWISDVSIIGDVLVGKPVQLRVRAGTDANVHDGHLQIDDIGVFGARYRNNVGIFVDGSPDRFGAYANTTTTVPVTIRNLGDTVRRDLALEVRVVGQGITVSGNGPGGNATLDNGAFVLKGFTLGPGQSAVANITVRTPRQVVEGATNAKLVLQLREANPQSQTRPFGPILDNEVQGLLMREVDFRLQAKGEFQTIDAGIRQVTPSVGETIEYVLTARNPGHGPIELNVTCVAQTVTGYADLNHVTQGPTEHPRVAATYPCDISGKTQLASKEWTNLTFRATPTEAGFLSFAVKIAIVGGDNITIPAAGVPVGTPLLTFRETFNRPEVLSNFTGNGFEWSHTRGHRGTGALLLGINETLALADTTPYTEACGIGQPCIAATPPIDLHNYSASTPAYLSFYHLDRMARWDGAQVRAQVLQDEIRPNAVASWSKECVLTPVHGYEGRVREWPTVPADPANPNGQMIPGDDNPAFDRAPYTGPPGATPVGTTKIMETRQDFFITPGGVWQEDWQLAVFRLPATCQAADGSGQVSLLGRTVRFLFMMFPGEPMGPPGASINRGDGHGFLVDEISVGPLALEVRPASQHANLLDNTTKGFNVLLRNLGRMPDLVRLEYDAQNSSAPENSVVVPSETYLLMPGERRTVTVHVTLPRDPSLLPTEFTARVLARSVLDPNAAGASLLNLQFGPRQWAELGLSVQAPRGIVQEGMETFIPLTIENTGLVDSVASRVRIIDEWPGGRVEHTLDLPSMPSYAQAADEAMRVLEFRWRPEPGSVGPHTLTFEIDPDQLGEEYTRDNNVVQLVVPVSDLLIPDLHIANFTALSIRNAVGGTVTPGFDADVARYEVTAGEVVSFELRVANRGRAGATNVDVGAFIGALSLPAKTIPYIAPGSETVVTFNWLAQKGEHKIEFFVRTEQPELTRLNNNYPGTGVTLLTVKGYEIVVEIPPIDGLLEPASEARVPFRITNNGNAGEDLVLVAKTPPGMRIMLPREGFFLRAGESYDDVARLILEAEAVAGQQFISIDAIARENPMKVASGRAALGVLASYGGSVAGGYASGAPTELVVPVELVNEGNSLEPWNVTLTLPAGWTTKEPMPARVIVPAHDRATFRFHVTIPADTAPGDRVLAVKAVMPNGEAREGVARVGVMPLRAAAVTVSDEAPAPVRGELAVPIKVQNTGNVREPFSVLLVDAPPGLQMRVEPAEFLLAPGAIAEATLIVKPNATIEVGTYAVAGYTRFAGVVPQTREGLANVQTLRVPIVRQDLRVTALEYSPRADLDAGDRVTVRATVQNFGQAPLTDVPVHLFVNDVFHSEVLVPRILAGARLDVTFNWTATTGVHTLTAVVDPYADTVDAAREDNAVSVLVTVGVAASAGGVAAGRADAPFGGAWLVLAALAVGMLVTRQLGSWRRERR